MMNTSPFIIIITTFMGLTVSPAQSRAPADSTAWRLVKQGKALLAENKLKDAEQSFRKALQKDRELAAAMAGLGQVYLAKQDWGEANDWYEKVLDREPENLDALYHRAICYRETGVSKALLLRKLDWNNSAKHFKRVLERDSLFYDTLYQYAQLLRYREDYTEAILLGHHQVRLKPELVEAQRGLFRLYQYFLDHHSEAEVSNWLQQYASEHARYFIGEAYRRSGKLAEADSVLQSWLASVKSVSKIPAYLSLTRLDYQRQQPQVAEKFFWQAVDGIRNQLDAELVFDDVKYIVTEAELQTFRRLNAPQDYMAFFHRLWISRDPTPAAGSNVRLAEHYRRLLYAEANYLFDGFRIWFNNPDKFKYLKFPPAFYLNDRFNDKGLIYIRHGEPDERAATINADILSNESWRYGKTAVSPEMIFHFVVDENATGNNWRLTPFLNDPQFWEDRVSWGTTYHRLLRGDPMERLALENEIARQSSVSVDSGFRTDRHSWEKGVKPLNLASYVAFFKAPEGKSYFDLYYGFWVSPEEKPAATPDTSVLFEHGLVLHDLQWNPIERLRSQITKDQITEVKQQQLLVGQYHVAVKPDSYHIAFFARQPATQHLGGWKDNLRIPPFSDDQLAMSSVVLASAIAPATASDAFVRNGLRVVPNPTRRFARAKPVYVYFEVYNLAPDAEGKTSFVVEYTTLLRKEKKAGAQKLFALFGSGVKPATTLVLTRQADSTTSAEYLALDLDRAGRGEFRLSVKVKDKNSGQHREGFVDFMLF